MTETELALLVQKNVKGLDNYLDQDDYTRAVEEAVRETGYPATSTNATKIHWLVQRSIYAIYGMLLSESAHKFKVKQYSLHHRFEHYLALRKYMDEQYNKFLEQEPIDPDSPVHIGGMKIDAGFQYDEDTGEDTTYIETNVVQFTPTEND
jgi:hypothetical protein